MDEEQLATAKAAVEALAAAMAEMIYERTQLVQADAEDLAWDLIALSTVEEEQ